MLLGSADAEGCLQGQSVFLARHRGIVEPFEMEGTSRGPLLLLWTHTFMLGLGCPSHQAISEQMYSIF